MIARMLAILFLAVFLVYPNSVQALELEKVLILNSDASIKRYLTAQALFKAEFAGDTVDVDLGDRWLTEKDFNKIVKKEQPKIIYAIGSKAYAWANRVDEDVKVVFSSLINWSRLQIDNRTRGIANELQVDMQMTLYRYLFPHLKRVGILYSDEFNREMVRKIEKSAKNMGIKLVKKTVKQPDEVQKSLQSLLPHVDSLWLIADPVVLSGSSTVKNIFAISHRAQIPIISYSDIFINFGASLILSADIPTMAKQVVFHINEIQKGNESKMQNVVDPAGSNIILNLKKVKEYGLELNHEALSSVNTFIE